MRVTACKRMVCVKDQLKAIWKKRPCYVVKARIGHLVIRQVSFHNLKVNNLLNDKVSI